MITHITTPVEPVKSNDVLGNEMTEKILAPVLECLRRDLFKFCEQELSDTQPNNFTRPYWEVIAWGFWNEVIIGGWVLSGEYYSEITKAKRPLSLVEIICGVDMRVGSQTTKTFNEVARSLLFLGEKFGGDYFHDAVFLVSSRSSVINKIYTWMNSAPSPLNKDSNEYYTWSHILKAFTTVEQNVKFLGIDKLREFALGYNVHDTNI